MNNDLSNRRETIICLVAALSLLIQTDSNSWVFKPTVVGEGYERLNGGKNLALSIRVGPGSFGFRTRRGIEGALFGIDRSEAVTSQGVFTWLTTKPNWVWQLLETSIPEYSSFLQPSRFKKSIFLQDKTVVSKAVGLPVNQLETGRLASRPVFMLTLGNSLSTLRRQQLWLDTETGITLKRLETTGANEDYALEWHSLNSEAVATPLYPTAGSKVVRGLIHPQSFEHIDKLGGEEDYLRSLVTIRNSNRKSSLSWLQHIIPHPDFQFVNTSASERDTSSLKQQQRSNALAGPEFMPGGLPPGWSATTEVDPDKGKMTMNLMRPGGGTAKIITQTPSSQSSTSTVAMSISSPNTDENVNLAFVIFMAKDGSLVVGPGNSRENVEEQRDHLIDQATGRFIVIRSDFLDPNTGDTLTFAQLNNRAIGKVFDSHLFKKQDSKVSKKLGSIQISELNQPYHISMISWISGDQELVLMSTKLTTSELIVVAESSSRMNP